MAQLCSSSLFLGYLLLHLSFHHASSMVSPTSVSTAITSMSKHGNETDRQALLSFKSMISSDPTGSLASWNDSLHFCRWLGVTCGGRPHPQRVISLSLSSLELAGIIPPAIANLTFLRKIDLSGNQIHGFIPEEIGRLFWLRHLNLSENSLEGEYGMANKVSTHGDVYSYGILLLEMFTGKRPTDDTFVGGLSLRMFVETAFPERILDAVDARLLLREDGNASDDTGGGMEGARAVECIAMVLRIGMSCSNELPAERMEMGAVIRELHQVKEFIRRE